MTSLRKGRCGSALKASLLAVGAASISLSVAAEDLYKPGSWSNLAGDRTAEQVGDGLTVLIQEASQASDSNQIVHQGEGSLLGRYTANSDDGQGSLSGNYKASATGQHGRSGQMVAQISVVVDAVLPNGDLHVIGDQLININGEKTQIHLVGRVRRVDISPANLVYSSSLSDLNIVYGGPSLTKGKERGRFLRRLFGGKQP